jgi:CelD/BcsL family acetyltransferase involved in cellulose biosynthesis
MHIFAVKPQALEEEIVASWAALQRDEPSFESPFFHPEFARRVARVRPDIEVAVVTDTTGPVAFWPFERRRGDVAGPPAGELSDYDGVIASPRLLEDYDLRALLRACRLNAWDYSGRLTIAPREPGRRKTNESRRIDLSGGYAVYLAKKRAGGSKLFERVGYLERRLAREYGPVQFILNENRAEVFDQLIAWKSAQYVRTQKRDIFASPSARAVLQEIAAPERDGFSGVLSALYAGDRLIAAHFGMRAHAMLHYWFPVYDAALARHSPGLVLLASLLGSVDQLGVAKIDLGTGNYPYKARLGTDSIEVFEGSLESANWRGRARSVQRTLVRLLKRTPLASPARALIQKSRRTRG